MAKVLHGAFTEAETAIAEGGLWAGIEVGDESGAFVTRSILGVSPEHGLGVATTPQVHRQSNRHCLCDVWVYSDRLIVVVCRCL